MTEDLAPARGIAAALVMVAPFWAVVWWVAYRLAAGS